MKRIIPLLIALFLSIGVSPASAHTARPDASVGWAGHVSHYQDACGFISQSLNYVGQPYGIINPNTYGSIDVNNYCVGYGTRPPGQLQVKQDIVRNGALWNSGPWISVGCWCHSVTTAFSWSSQSGCFYEVSYVRFWWGGLWVTGGHATSTVCI
jgi:hypothetical protein